MLSKLLKHELKATSRYFFPLYLALLCITILNKFFFEINITHSSFSFLDFFRGLILAAYILIICTVFVVGFIITILRFYKNLLGDEGYLMFTLPVKIHQHITSKLIISLFWSFLSVIMFIISISILLTGTGFLSEFWVELTKVINEGYRIVGNKLTLSIFLFIVLIPIGQITSILMFYVSISIGHLSNKYKILGSIVAYFIINFIIQFISTAFMFIYGLNNNNFETLNDSSASFAIDMVTFMNDTFIFSLVFTIIFGSIFFLATNYILTKKLNLE